ncbi:lipoprotein-releasing system transmembrane subunit, LolC/LolE family [Aliidiomarina taiwanensis]|uniref:Lipoprotein-releasing system transmembrane subunit, LolC/LolE family n=1 Tax=Aliidiomarina taiwanensis TaxID=946228 RepID=A0A432XAP2_9GAMM|nr:lipoprotein-releasing ABC transporter permease subunit [Aliidiomarina taiwanensis]RUO44394.1 lipoprotein-releasing system transmembrane subunit, LolC/LolE family [Aliidiomarina taiwanensis]
MSLAFLLARRFRRAKQSSSGYVGFISRSSTIGIALGCAILITLLSIMNGFHKALEDDLLSVIPHVEFESVSGTLTNWREVKRRAEAHEQVLAAAPVMRITGMVQQQRRFYGVDIRAIDTSLEPQVSRVTEYTSAATWQAFEQDPEGVLLGAGLADNLGIQVGDKLMVIVPEVTPHGGTNRAPKRLWLTYKGAFAFGGELDFRQAYMHLGRAQQLMGVEDAANAVRLRVNDVYAAPHIAADVGFELSEYAYMHDWTRSQGHLYRDIQMVRTVMYIVLFLVLAVASFNIVATLMMQVEEKRAAIAILKTMGAADSLILRTFVWQGALNGIPGAFVGALLGWLMATELPSILQGLEQLLGHSLLAGDIYFVNRIPVDVQGADIVLVTGTALLMSLLATLYPAYRASQLAPAASLRQS